MKKIFEILSMVTLLVWGGMFLYFFFSGRVNDYLTSSFRIWVPVSGVGMIILGALNLITRNRDTGACSHDHIHGDHSHCDHEHDHDHHDHSDCDHDHHHDETCDHGHDHHHDHAHDHHHEETTASSLAFALIVLLVPLLTAAKYSQDSFSRQYTGKWVEIEDDMRKLRQKKAAVARQETADSSENPYTNPDGSKTEEETSGSGEEWGEFTIEDLKKMVPQTSAGDFLLDVPQIYYTAGDQELMKVMEGISIETTAQVIEDTVDDSPSNRLRAYRLMIECCAADARPLSIPIDFAEALPEYEEMGWYKLIGRLHFHESAEHEYVPILQIKNFQPTPEPADWMAY